MQNQHSNRLNQTYETYLKNKEQNKLNTKGIAGFTMSLVSLLTVWISVISMISIIFFFITFLHGVLTISALIFSIIGLRKPKNGFAISGLIISILVILIYLFFVLGTTYFIQSLATQEFG